MVVSSFCLCDRFELIESGYSIPPELLSGMRLWDAIPEPESNKNRSNDHRGRHQETVRMTRNRTAMHAESVQVWPRLPTE